MSSTSEPSSGLSTSTPALTLLTTSTAGSTTRSSTTCGPICPCCRTSARPPRCNPPSPLSFRRELDFLRETGVVFLAVADLELLSRSGQGRLQQVRRPLRAGERVQAPVQDAPNRRRHAQYARVGERRLSRVLSAQRRITCDKTQVIPKGARAMTCAF